MRAVLLFVGVALAAGQHSQPSIAGLIPTVDVLGGACVLTPRPTEQVGEKVFRSGLWGPVPIPRNPWFGDDPSKVAAIREIVVGFEGAVRLPDGPPLDRNAAERWRHQSAEGAKGAAVAYGNGPEQVLLYALQSSRLEAGGLDVTNGPGLHSTMVIRTAGIWVRLTGMRGTCFDALRRHVEEHTQPR